MNVVILSPHFPPNHINYAKALQRLGDNVLGIGDDPNPPQELRNTLTEYCCVRDMTNYDHMVRTLGYLTSKYGKLDRIDSQNEFWLGIEAKLREDFNIFGQKTKETDINRNKLDMKAVCIAAGIPVAPGEQVQDLDALKEFAHKVQYPIIVKPVIGVGASETYAIHSDKECDEIFPKLATKNIAEKFIKGQIVTFDAFIDRYGEILFYTSHEYNSGIMETITDGNAIYFHSKRELDPKLIELGKKAIEAFHVRERFVHIEWFRTAPHTYIILEINVRTPGYCIIDMMNYSADVNLYELWARALHGQKAFEHYERKYSVGFAGRRNSVPYIHSNEDIIKEFPNTWIIQQYIPGSLTSCMGDQGYIVRDPDENVVLNVLRYILAV